MFASGVCDACLAAVVGWCAFDVVHDAVVVVCCLLLMSVMRVLLVLLFAVCCCCV